MKKIILIIQFITVAILFSSTVYASGGDHGHRKHHKHRHHDYDERGYYPDERPRYYSEPRYQDPRSHQGLAGGVLGSVLGYEIGKGDPIAAGLGAAAGSYLGNGISGRR